VTPCQAEPEVWFSTNAADIAEAQQACRTCPALVMCDELADQMKPADGIWAGKTAEERDTNKTRPYQILTPGHVRRARALRSAGNTWREVARVLDVPVSAISKAAHRAEIAERVA